ncbi:hypothetical protein EW145_g5535 [Phellinidium pouzarii]|uniref:Fe2OG dioxygenase domain-containing protein n=1 Tax=Phellinidium pouzarii TaxID=167371 RepID=A0A4S4KZV0_9AGAM|nr:hypothetical protein EW145_g5535 [Phellinidium pouzarii]
MDFANFDLSMHSVDTGGLAQVHYIPDFVTEEEEAYLLRQINSAPRPKWKSLANRRLQVWGGDLTSSNKLLAQPLPPFLNKYPDIIGRLRATGAFSSSKNGMPNHVIVNEYLPNQGIMPHEDGPSYHPVVATISLGSHTIFNYYQYKDNTLTSPTGASSDLNPSTHSESERGRVIDATRPVLSLLLEPRSLVITTGALYTDHLHGIDPRAEDVFLPAGSESTDLELKMSSFSDATEKQGVMIANWQMIRDTKMRETITEGGALKRNTRISLTCRDVERVVGGKPFR